MGLILTTPPRTSPPTPASVAPVSPQTTPAFPSPVPLESPPAISEFASSGVPWSTPSKLDWRSSRLGQHCPLRSRAVGAALPSAVPSTVAPLRSSGVRSPRLPCRAGTGRTRSSGSTPLRLSPLSALLGPRPALLLPLADPLEGPCAPLRATWALGGGSGWARRPERALAGLLRRPPLGPPVGALEGRRSGPRALPCWGSTPGLSGAASPGQCLRPYGLSVFGLWRGSGGVGISPSGSVGAATLRSSSRPSPRSSR